MAGVRVGRGNVSPASLQTSPAVELIARKNQPLGYLGLNANGDATLPSPGFLTSFGHTILTDKGDTPNVVIRRGGPNNRFAGAVGSDIDPTKNLASLPSGNQIGLVSANPRAEPICHANGTQVLAALMTGTALSVHDLPSTWDGAAFHNPPAPASGQFPASGNIAVVSNDSNTYMLSYSGLTGGLNAGTGADGSFTGIGSVAGHDAPANVTAVSVLSGNTLVTGILPPQRTGAVFGVTGAGIPAGPPITTITFTGPGTGVLSVPATATGVNVPLSLGGSVTDLRTISLVEDDFGNAIGRWASKPVQWEPYASEDVTNSNGTVKAGGGVRMLTTPTGGTSLQQSADFRSDGALDFVSRAMGLYFASSQSITQNVQTVVKWDTVDPQWSDNYDDETHAGWYDHLTGLYKPPMAGLYELNAQLQFTTSFAANVQVTLSAFRTTTMVRERPMIATGLNEVFYLSTMVYVDPTIPDTISLKVTHTAGGAKLLTADRRYCWMQLRYVGRTTAIGA